MRNIGVLKIAYGTPTMILKIFLFLLAFVNISISNEYSGLLSRLYKKANNENRPLILVLDNPLNNLDDPQSLKTNERYVAADRNAPYNLLDLSNQKHQKLKFEHRHKLYDHPLVKQRENGPKYQQSDLQNLAYRLKKEREQERREKRERKLRKERRNRAQDREVELDRDDARQERYQVRKPDILQRYQDRRQDRYQDRGKDRNQEQSQYQEESNLKSEKRALRSSVIKNLLRTYNDINCDAKEECADECGETNDEMESNDCEKNCEVKYDCDESEKEEDLCADDECADDAEEATGSTRGERLVTVTEKCVRC